MQKGSLRLRREEHTKHYTGWEGGKQEDIYSSAKQHAASQHHVFDKATLAIPFLMVNIYKYLYM